MEIEQIEEFVILSETFDYEEASSRLFISPSTLSKHIKQLEADIGETLIDRSEKKVSLTDYGQFFLTYAKEIMQSYGKFLNDSLKRSTLKSKKRIKVGMSPVINQFYLIDLLVNYQKKYATEIDILEYSDKELIDRLLSGNCHSAFLYEADADSSVLSCSVNYSDTLVAVVPKKFAPVNGVRLDDIPFDLYLPKEGSDMYGVFERLAEHSSDEELKKAIRNAHHSASITEAIKHEYGYTLMPKKYIEFEGKRQFSIDENEYNVISLEPPIKVDLNCVFATKFMESPSGREFFDNFIK